MKYPSGNWINLTEFITWNRKKETKLEMEELTTLLFVRVHLVKVSTGWRSTTTNNIKYHHFAKKVSHVTRQTEKKKYTRWLSFNQKRLIQSHMLLSINVHVKETF